MFIYEMIALQNENTNAVNAFGGGCCCLGMQSFKTIIQKTLKTDFAQAFQSDQNNISMLCNEIGPLLVRLSRLIAQSHMTFLMLMVEFIRKMWFHCILCTLFSYQMKSLSFSVRDARYYRTDIGIGHKALNVNIGIGLI